MIRSRYFRYKDFTLHCESVALQDLSSMLLSSSKIAFTETPIYVYSKNQLLDNISSYKNAFKDKSHIIGYSMKANANREILKIIHQNDLSVVVVSGFEMRLALEIGFPGSRIFFNGNGKQKWEMKLAIENDCIMNVDSIFNARQLAELMMAPGGDVKEEKVVQVFIRMNVDIATNVHPYLQTVSKNSKFGVISDDFEEVLSVLAPVPGLKVIGLHCHLGSTIDDVSIYTRLFASLEMLLANAKGNSSSRRELFKHLSIINVGGGLGINYYHEESKDTPTVSDLSRALPDGSPFTLMVEPGRSMIGNAGALLTGVVGVKKTSAKTFVVTDASMTELVRPALYAAYHNILPVRQGQTVTVQNNRSTLVDFVGPVCESGDFLGKDRPVSAVPADGDLFAVMDAGAYGFAMASNYNLRARPAEVLVDGSEVTVIRERESYEEVVRGGGGGGRPLTSP